MTAANPTFVEMQRTIGDTLRAHWRLYVFQGVLMIILGVLAVAAPAFATLTVDIYVGWLFLISGVLGLIAMFSARNVPGFLWTLVTALLSIVVGGMLLWKPVEGAAVADHCADSLFYRRRHLSSRGRVHLPRRDSK